MSENGVANVSDKFVMWKTKMKPKQIPNRRTHTDTNDIGGKNLDPNNSIASQILLEAKEMNFLALHSFCHTLSHCLVGNAIQVALSNDIYNKPKNEKCVAVVWYCVVRA